MFFLYTGERLTFSTAVLCRKIWVKFVFLQRDGSLALNVAVVLLSKVYSTHDEQGHIVSRLELNSDSLVELN